MFRLCIVLMIALLPLRAVAGDLMRVQWAAAQEVSAVEATMPPGCPMHASADDAAAEPEPGTAGGSLAACESCELCMPLLEIAGGHLHTTSLADHAQPVLPDTGFMSATPARGFKPPIS